MPPLKQPDSNWIGCAVCLQQKSKRVKAVTIAAGYAVCSIHIGIVSRPGFNIFTLQDTKKAV